MKDGIFVQYDDRNPKWAQKLIERNQRAASTLDYDHVYLTTSEYDYVAPYWRKVFLVEKYLKVGYNIVVWIDSDAVLVNEVEFQKCVQIEMENYCMSFSSNPGILRQEWWPFRLWAAPFCAGVFVVKNTLTSHDIMKTWMDSYVPSSWKIVEQNGKKTWVGEGIYGGLSYEQGCFEVHIFRSDRFRKHLLQFNHLRMNYLPLRGELCTSKTIFLHYWNGNRLRIWKDWGGKIEDYTF